MYVWQLLCHQYQIYIMFKIRSYYNNAFRQVMSSDSWNFSRTWNTLACPHHFTKRGIWTNKTNLTPPLLLQCLYLVRKVRCHYSSSSSWYSAGLILSVILHWRMSKTTKNPSAYVQLKLYTKRHGPSVWGMQLGWNSAAYGSSRWYWLM